MSYLCSEFELQKVDADVLVLYSIKNVDLTVVFFHNTLNCCVYAKWKETTVTEHNVGQPFLSYMYPTI